MISVVFLASCAAATRPAPALPSADALREWWRGREPLSAKLDLCVSPSGAVSDVRLARSSGDRFYDAAVVHDVAHWTLAVRAARSACEATTVTYVP